MNDTNASIPGSTLSKEVYDKEIGMCRKLMKEKSGCNWGKCKECGVIPLLYKLHKGLLLEDTFDIQKVKDEILG